MVRHKHHGKGYRTRKVKKKNKRQKGCLNVNVILQEFKPGDKVHVIMSSSVASTSPHRRFVGKTGKIIRKQGSCYLVEIKDMRAKKKILLHPAHIRKAKQ